MTRFTRSRVSGFGNSGYFVVNLGDGSVLLISAPIQIVGEMTTVVDPEYQTPFMDWLAGQEVEVLWSDAGELKLDFLELSWIVSPTSDFEAWDIQHPDGRRVVSLPGGGVATWGVGTEGDSREA